MSKRPIYMAIMDAAERGRGLRLSAEEIRELSRDDAIVTRAAVELEDDDEFVVADNFTWRAAYRQRRAALSKGA